MTADSYITFLIASLVITFLPGPTVLLLVHYALQYGRWAGRFTIPAVIVGDIVALNLAFIGLGAALKLFPESFITLKIIGGLYLLGLGVSSLLSKESLENENQTMSKPPGRRIFTHVFFVTAFNPKTIIFFLAFFPQFINPAANTLNQLLLMGFSFIVLGIIGATIYDMAASRISIWIKKSSAQKTVHITTGILLCGLGLTTIIF